MLGQVLGCDVREHLLGRRVVKGDLVLLDKLAHEEVPKGDMLGPGTEHAISRNAECSCAVDCAVRDCVFDPKLIGAPPRKNRYSVVDLRLSGLAPNDASVYDTSLSCPFRYVIGRSGVPRRSAGLLHALVSWFTA